MVSWSNDVAKFRLSGGYRSSSRCDRVVIATVIRNLIVFPTLGSLTVLRSGTSSLLLLLELRFGESSQLLSLNQGVPSSRVLIFGLSLWESSHFLLLELSLGALSYLLLLVLGGVVTFVAVGAGGVNAATVTAEVTLHVYMVLIPILSILDEDETFLTLYLHNL